LFWKRHRRAPLDQGKQSCFLQKRTSLDVVIAGVLFSTNPCS